MRFAFLNDLCESHLIPSRTSLKNWDTKKLAELGYLYFLGLRVLLGDEATKKWAQDYCKKAGEPNDFVEWRTNGNDLYVILHALSADPDEDESSKEVKHIHISPGIIRNWLRHVAAHDIKEETHRLFVRLDSMFHIDNASMKSMRRIVTEWHDADRKEQKDVLTKLIQMIHTRAPSNSEILSHLKKITGDLVESASTGSTGAANVAAVVGGLGAGFDPNGDWRSIYPKKKKPIMLKRNVAESLHNDLDNIRRYLKREYWLRIEEQPTREVWRHMDDSRIGTYILNLTPDGREIENVVYVSPISSIFNRKFDTIGQLIHHISTITSDEDPEGMANGAIKMQDIAKELRRKKNRDQSEE